MIGQKADIETRADVELMVNEFYNQVRQDVQIGPIFNNAIGDNWDKHLPTMYGFWSQILLGEGNYQGHPFAKHIDLPIMAGDFTKWLQLFDRTIDDLFRGEKASEAKLRAKSIAQIFELKLGLKT